MPTQARRAFDKNCEDVERLLEVHALIAGSGAGRKHQVEVLNKAAVVLITAFWEAYCEDLAAEALEFLVDNAPDTSKLPKELRKRVAKELEADKNELAVWQVAGDGWRAVLTQRLARLQVERNWNLNTPKSAKLDALFLDALGISDLSSGWSWQGMSSEDATTKLNDYVSLRGEIAHRGASATAVRKSDVTGYYELVKKLVGRTGALVKKELKVSTGKSLY